MLQLAFRRQWIRRSTKQQEAIIDRTEILETVVFQFQLCSSWRNSYLLVKSMYPAGSRRDEALSRVALAGGILAYILVSLQVLYLLKYAIATYAMVLAQRAKKAGESAYADSGSRLSARVLHTTLDRLGHSRMSADRRA